ncbi:MAG: YncE family protein [Bacteroidales bacterium]
MNKGFLKYIILIICVMIGVSSCRKGYPVIVAETVEVYIPEYSSVDGFFLLNEGNMGTNKSTLDYYDYTTGEYTRNLYSTVNSSVTMDLGDVGNDLKVYGSRMYAVINCSNKVEVMDAKSATRIGQVDIPNCRYIAFHEGYAYVTSYAGPVQVDSNYEQLGYVAKVDTLTLEVVAECIVGYQPDGLAIVNDRIYVANSGGYMVPNYENTLTVIDIDSFTEVNQIVVAENLSNVCADKYGNLWVTSRGDYYDLPSQLFCVNTTTEMVTDTLDIATSSLWLDGDSLYICGSSWSYTDMTSTVTYGIVNVKDKAIVTNRFINDGTESNITLPYGIAVNPINKDIYVADARNYVTSGYLYCYDSDGILKWSVRTGEIPANIAFIGELKNEEE